MKPFGEFFEIMLNSCCAFLGVNNNDFFFFYRCICHDR